jgi:copper chaperone CopZ
VRVRHPAAVGLVGVRGPGGRATGRYCAMITRLRIAGMTCQRCVQAVFTSLTPIGGIRTADVRIGGATIEHDGSVTVEALRDAIAVSGYEVALADENRRRLPLL